MRVQNIFDIALFDSGLADNIFLDTIFKDTMPHSSIAQKNIEPLRKNSPHVAFAPYPVYFNTGNKVKARPLETT
jgi:hypothetical protein